MEYFITDIEIKNVRHIKDLKIPLSQEKRRHLLITGKNGSGKTSLLEEIQKHLESMSSGKFLKSTMNENLLKMHNNSLNVIEAKLKSVLEDDERRALEKKLETEKQNFEKIQSKFSNEINLSIVFSNYENILSEIKTGNLILAFFEANRQSSMQIPNSIAKIDFKSFYSPKDRAAEQFLQYLVYLKTQQAFAVASGEEFEFNRIQKWFIDLQNQLRELFEEETLNLDFDRKSLNFSLRLENRDEIFDFTTLSAGHTAYLEIVSELIMRMEKNEVSSYDLQGIVLIDEIETHLHVSLQKKILPFLTTLFPKIQFIVTTHSPFVLNSIPDTIICDLENRTVMEDFSAYSYESIVEKYFGAEQYSQEIQEKMNEYIRLMQKHELNTPEELDLDQLRTYLNSIPYNMAPEVKIKFNQLELDRESEKL